MNLHSSHCREIQASFNQGIWCPFPLRQQTQVPSHIRIAEGSLLLRCLWKVGLPRQLTAGNQISSRDDMGARCLPPVAVPKLVFLST